MASLMPLKTVNGSNIGRPAMSGLPRPSGLKPPSSGLKQPTAGLKQPTAGLKPPTAGLKIPYTGLKVPSLGLKAPTAGLIAPVVGQKVQSVKRSASPNKDDIQVSKRSRPEPRAAVKPVTRKPITTRSTVPANRSRIGSQLSTQSVSKPAVADVGGGKTKRAAWDYKGRLQDMEKALAGYMNENTRTTSRVEQLEAQRQDLRGQIQVKEKITSEATDQIAELNSLIRSLEDQLASSTRTFQQEITNLEFSKTAVERQRTLLDAELQASHVENLGLKSTVAELKSTVGTLTATNVGVKAVLEVAELNLQQSLQMGRLKDATILEYEATICEAKKKEREFETDRRRLHNTVQELKGNIRVFCRVRPLLGEECFGNDGEVGHISFPDQDKDGKTLELEKVGELAVINESIANVAKNGKKYAFSFDRVFPPKSGQDLVFEEISQLVQSALDGYNVCIFAYGQTGSGKTYTMEGPVNKNHEDRGMIPRAVEQVFQTGVDLEEQGWQYGYEASFLEIYNETIRDLLGNGSTEVKHEIKMISKDSNELIVSNLTTVAVTCENQVSALLKTASQNRAVAETKSNERSSRSHSVFRLRMTGVNKATEGKCCGMLNLIDLAGSERLKESGSQGARLKETQCINKSLANLGNVIMALANKDPHIPYRNSKLTHLLLNSLGGNSKTLMFVNVSPREESSGETLCSLRFATKVNGCNIGTAQKRAK